MSRAVLDTSALLALCLGEKGAKAALARGENGILSAVSYSEAIAKSLDLGVPLEIVSAALAGLKLTIVSFDRNTPSRPRLFVRQLAISMFHLPIGPV